LVLVDAQIEVCPKCGDRVIHTPAVDQLHELITSVLAEKKSRLSGSEIRFMRNHIGLESGEFAKVIGSDPGTVSRWESGKQTVGRHSDLLIRALVLLHNKATFKPEVFREVEWNVETVGRMAFRYRRKKWATEKVAA
jgi:putative zinc finger/helix-turn-helix YgiT family protein